MATWFEIVFTGVPTADDFARVAELAVRGFTGGQLLNDTQCAAATDQGGVYGEEQFWCNLRPHAGAEHFDRQRRLWWDVHTRLRVPASRLAELRRTYANEL